MHLMLLLLFYKFIRYNIVGRDVGGGVQDEGTHVYQWLMYVDGWLPIKINNLKKLKKRYNIVTVPLD